MNDELSECPGGMDVFSLNFQMSRGWASTCGRERHSAPARLLRTRYLLLGLKSPLFWLSIVLEHVSGVLKAWESGRLVNRFCMAKTMPH